MTDIDVDAAVEPEIDAVDFYWRPGCGFCMALDRRLSNADIPMRKKNIWENPDHASFVRSVANGNETVPTVVVGPVAMVNPRLAEVIDALSRHAPHLVPADDDTHGPLGTLADKLFGR